MAYIKTNWQDQKVERPHTYEANANPDGSFTLVDSFGNVEQMGTPVNAQNMNKIEAGIAGNAIRLHNMTEIFAKDEWVKSGDKLYKSKQDQNKGHAVTEPEWYSEVSLGGGMPVGTIFPHSASISHIPENSVPCDGMEYTKEQFGALYNDFLVLKRLETCTYEQYQQDIANNGACAKFALDTVNGKFKVPLIPDGYYIKKGQGTSNKAGLPQHKHFTARNEEHNAPSSNLNSEQSIAWSSSGAGNGYVAYALTGSNNEGNIGLTSGASNSIYGKSSTVETNAVAYRYFVVAATGSIKQSEMDWSRYMDGLNGKLNIDVQSNITKDGKAYISSLSMPSKKYIDIATGVAGATYIAPANGYFALSGRTTSDRAYITSEITEDNNLYKVASCSITGFTISLLQEAVKGRAYSFGYGNVKMNNTIRFVYAQGEV